MSEIRASQPALLIYLNMEQSLPFWIRDGWAATKERLETIRDNLRRYGQLLGLNCSEAIKHELVARAICRPESLGDIESLGKHVQAASDAGVLFPDSAEWTDLRSHLHALAQSLDVLQSSFPEQVDDLRVSLRGKPLADAQVLLAAEVERYAAQKKRLQEERTGLRNALALLGHPVGSAEAPRSLEGLRQEVEGLKEQCVSTAGDHSLTLLAFFQGEGTFPRNLSLDEVEKALTSLRPLVRVALEYGVPNA